MDDLALWPEGTICVGCTTASYGSMEMISTQRNKSPIEYVFFLHLVVKFYKRVHSENVTAGHNVIATEYLSVFLNPADSQMPIN
jgi:hypothetical protein